MKSFHSFVLYFNMLWPFSLSHVSRLRSVVFFKTLWSSQPPPSWNGKRGYPQVFMDSPDLFRSLDWPASRATRWRPWKGWNTHCLTYRERRPSGCSGTQWRMLQRRLRRQPRAWLQLLLSHRNPSSTSDRTVCEGLLQVTWTQHNAFLIILTWLIFSGMSLIAVFSLNAAICVFVGLPLFTTPNLFLSLFSTFRLLCPLSLNLRCWAYLWNKLPLWKLSDFDQQHPLMLKLHQV